MTTDPRAANTAKPINGGWFKVAWLSGLLFVALLLGLAWQMYSGNDPLLGAGAQQAAEPATIKRRLVIKRKVIEQPSGYLAEAPAPAPAEPQTYQPPSSSYQQPAAPAPAPAAPTTRSS